MSREELLESAALDAFGLLDEYEASLYTRSFHHAPATVQDEVARIQAEWATDETFLAAAEPEQALRQKTLESVARAIERETSELAPLATIGRQRPMPTERHQRLGMGFSGQLWRAAAFALVGMVVVMAYFLSQALESNKGMVGHLGNQITEEQVKAMIGEDFTYFVKNPNCRQHFLAPTSGNTGMATVFVHENTQQVFLLGMGIPQTNENSPYTLSARLADGTLHELTRFVSSNGSVTGLRIDKVSSALLASATWEISNSAGKVVLRTV